MTRALLTALVLFGVATAHSADVAGLPWRDARQLILVTTPGWDANHGELQTFEMTRHGWSASGPAAAVVIGRSGSAWGIGLHPEQPGPVKKEGDGRSPAGVFRIGEAFGYAQSIRTALPYASMSESDYCVDVSGSPLYNRIVDAHTVEEAAVEGSTEPMRRDLYFDGDQRYKIGFVIEHNPDGTAGAGSCIFAHLWKGATQATSGCTAMPEPLMRKLLAWLRPEEHPVFVLLPQKEYARLREAWRLPGPG